jgi:hypothetical protein
VRLRIESARGLIVEGTAGELMAFAAKLTMGAERGASSLVVKTSDGEDAPVVIVRIDPRRADGAAGRQDGDRAD